MIDILKPALEPKRSTVGLGTLPQVDEKYIKGEGEHAPSQSCHHLADTCFNQTETTQSSIAITCSHSFKSVSAAPQRKPTIRLEILHGTMAPLSICFAIISLMLVRTNAVSIFSHRDRCRNPQRGMNPVCTWVQEDSCCVLHHTRIERSANSVKFYGLGYDRYGIAFQSGDPTTLVPSCGRQCNSE